MKFKTLEAVVTDQRGTARILEVNIIELVEKQAQQKNFLREKGIKKTR